MSAQQMIVMIGCTGTFPNMLSTEDVRLANHNDQGAAYSNPEPMMAKMTAVMPAALLEPLRFVHHANAKNATARPPAVWSIAVSIMISSYRLVLSPELIIHLTGTAHQAGCSPGRGDLRKHCVSGALGTPCQCAKTAFLQVTTLPGCAGLCRVGTPTEQVCRWYISNLKAEI